MQSKKQFQLTSYGFLYIFLLGEGKGKEEISEAEEE